jgi:hypothetical protein
MNRVENLSEANDPNINRAVEKVELIKSVKLMFAAAFESQNVN